MVKKIISFILLLSLLVSIVFGDSNGIWHYAEDVVPGIFGKDEGGGPFTFNSTILYGNDTTFFINNSNGRGIWSESFTDDGIAGITSASGKSAIYGWAKNSNAYSGYFEGGNFIIASGSVGIGTTSPTAKLDVNGVIKGDDFFINNKKGCGKLYTDSNGSIKCGIDNINDADSDPTNELQNLNNVLSIGNDAAGYKIVNLGGLKIISNTDRGVLSESTVNDGIAGITSASGKSAIYGWAKNSNAYSGYFEGGNFIIASGNVGIGTTNPTAKLDVNGVIKSTGGNSNNWNTAFIERGSQIAGNQLNWDGSKLNVQEGSGSGLDADTLDGLHASSFMLSSTDNWVNDGGDSMSGGLGIGYSQPSGTNLVVNGNVGIGTASPTQKLDVVGIIRGDNFIIDNKKSCGKLYTDSNGNVKCGTDNVNDADSNPTNEIQTLSRSGSTIYLSKGGGSVSVNDADSSTTNELQNLYSVLSRGNSAGNKRITSLGYPIYSSDAATKGYVDSKIATSSSGGTIQAGWYSSCPSGWTDTGLTDCDTGDGHKVDEDSCGQGGGTTHLCLRII